MKVDRRTIYTQNVIKEALLKLLDNQSLKKITVREICLKADVNRATFYRHFTDIYNLYEEICKEIISKVYPLEENTYFSYQLLEIIKENQGFYKEFFHAHINSPDLKKIIKTIFDDQNNMDKTNYDPKDYKYVFDFHIYGVTGLLKEWVDNNCQEPIDEIYEVINKITKNII